MYSEVPLLHEPASAPQLRDDPGPQWAPLRLRAEQEEFDFSIAWVPRLVPPAAPPGAPPGIEPLPPPQPPYPPPPWPQPRWGGPFFQQPPLSSATTTTQYYFMEDQEQHQEPVLESPLSTIRPLEDQEQFQQPLISEKKSRFDPWSDDCLCFKFVHHVRSTFLAFAAGVSQWFLNRLPSRITLEIEWKMT